MTAPMARSGSCTGSRTWPTSISPERGVSRTDREVRSKSRPPI
ncbi:hypothetical protein ACIBK9_07155 [Nonomuraea sp. NPDC050227]